MDLKFDFQPSTKLLVFHATCELAQIANLVWTDKLSSGKDVVKIVTRTSTRTAGLLYGEYYWSNHWQSFVPREWQHDRTNSRWNIWDTSGAWPNRIAFSRDRASRKEERLKFCKIEAK